MNILITGASGFIGGYLAKYCLEAGSFVLGIDIREPGDMWRGAAFECCDVRSATRLQNLISTFKPDRIFHLAAQSHPAESLVRPRETMDTNVGGTINLFEILRAYRLMALVVVACSSAEYGEVANRELPVQESHSLRPLHPYGVSKVAQDLLAAQYFANYSIPSIRVRIFNTTGPGQRGDMCSDLVSRSIEIEQGIRPPLMMVGNLTNRRAILDVRDLVRALWLSAEHCAAGEVYNVGADQIFSAKEVIDIIRTQLSVGFEVMQDPALIRACDEAIVAGDNSKFRSCCAWTPEIQLATTIREMLSWWRVQLNAPAAAIIPRSIPRS
jgi:GDP-4-dehydro-6-deoxy-D-mannose reductase